MSVEKLKKDLAATYATAERTFGRGLDQIDAVMRQLREHLKTCPEGLACTRVATLVGGLISLSNGLPLDIMAAKLAANATASLLANVPDEKREPAKPLEKVTVH